MIAPFEHYQVEELRERLAALGYPLASVLHVHKSRTGRVIADLDELTAEELAEWLKLTSYAALRGGLQAEVAS